jgi:hypothetical protein
MAWNRSEKDTCSVGAVGFGVGTLFNLVKQTSDAEYPIDDSMKY